MKETNLGGVFMKDTDGNIGLSGVVSSENVGYQLFLVSEIFGSFHISAYLSVHDDL